jgi:outer membrane protein W
VDFDPKAGAGLRLEYRFSKSLGFEFGFLGTSSFAVDVGDLGDGFGTATSVSSFAPLTTGINYHFNASERVDLYAGPLFAFVRYGDVSVRTGTGGVQTIDSVDSDTGFGFILGLDVPLGSSNWLFQSNLRYIATGLAGSTADGSFDSDFDPLILSVGVGYRF